MGLIIYLFFISSSFHPLLNCPKQVNVFFSTLLLQWTIKLAGNSISLTNEPIGSIVLVEILFQFLPTINPISVLEPCLLSPFSEDNYSQCKTPSCFAFFLSHSTV